MALSASAQLGEPFENEKNSFSWLSVMYVSRLARFPSQGGQAHCNERLFDQVKRNTEIMVSERAPAVVAAFPDKSEPRHP